jgi:hypothetical protein
MSLFISNPTKQDFVFHYRVLADRAEDRLLKNVAIPSGRGVEIGHDWSPQEKQHVIKQLELHGARDAAESYHGKLGNKFLGLLYRDRGQIDSQEIEAGHAAVVATQEARSVSEATRAALGFDRSMNAGKRGQRPVKTSGVEVIEQLAPHARPTGNEVAFSMSVDPEGRSDVAMPA